MRQQPGEEMPLRKPFEKKSELPFFKKPSFLAWSVIATVAFLITMYFVS